jgi:hypothetical protein
MLRDARVGGRRREKRKKDVAPLHLVLSTKLTIFEAAPFVRSLAFP